MKKLILFLLLGFSQLIVAQKTETETKAEQEDLSVYNTAGIEVKPEFSGGMNEFYSYVARNYWVPNMKDLSGTVYISFIVEKDGSINEIKVIRDIGFGTGEEAIRVMQKCKNWIPGTQNGKNVRVLYSLPIKIGPGN